MLKRYSDWLLTLRDKGVMVVDAHEAVSRHLAEDGKPTRNTIFPATAFTSMAPATG